MFPLSQFRKYNFTFDNSNHALSAWQGRKKKQQFTEVRNFEFIYKTTVTILCLYFYVTPVQIQLPSLYINQALLLNFFSKYQSISLAALNVTCAWYLHPPRPIHLPTSIFPFICFELLITRTFFNFRTRFELSGVHCIIVNDLFFSL